MAALSMYIPQVGRKMGNIKQNKTKIPKLSVIGISLCYLENVFGIFFFFLPEFCFWDFQLAINFKILF